MLSCVNAFINFKAKTLYRVVPFCFGFFCFLGGVFGRGGVVNYYTTLQYKDHIAINCKAFTKSVQCIFLLCSIICEKMCTY